MPICQIPLRPAYAYTCIFTRTTPNPRLPEGRSNAKIDQFSLIGSCQVRLQWGGPADRGDMQTTTNVAAEPDCFTGCEDKHSTWLKEWKASPRIGQPEPQTSPNIQGCLYYDQTFPKHPKKPKQFSTLSYTQTHKSTCKYRVIHVSLCIGLYNQRQL